MSDTFVDVVSNEEKQLVYTAADLLKRSIKKRRKKSSLALYQSRQKCTRLAKGLRRRVYEGKSNLSLLHLNDSSTSAYSESVTLGYSNSSIDLGNVSNLSTSQLPNLNENATASPSNEESIEIDDRYVSSCYKQLVDTSLLKKFLLMLDTHECIYDFMNFVNLIVDEKLSVMNLPFLLLMDLVRFMCCKTTTQMKYRVQTKQFWEAVYRFGGGTMIRLFSGLKNFGHVCMKKCKKSLYDPLLADLNFAVPDVTRLAETVGIVKDKVKCGFIEESFDMIDKSKEYNLSVDGKKISPGCSEDEGDISIFGLEGPPTLQEQKDRLNNELKFVQDMLDKEESDETYFKSNVVDLENIIKMCSNRIKDQRTTQVNQELLKITFQKAMEKDSSTINKFTHAISSIDTSIIFSQDLVTKILQQNKNLCELMSQIRGNYSNFIQGCHVELEKQNNCITLIPPEKVVLPEDEELIPEYTKQGSDAWKKLRQEAVMTSSTAYAALGMDTVKKQRELFSQRVLGAEPEPISEELQQRFDHGHRNEVHAFGTIAAVVLPAYFHRAKSLCQVGSFFLDGDQRKKLVVVSPDGLITTIGGDKSDDLSVEIKSPMGDKPFVLPVHYEIPGRYVPQVLLQMKVTKVVRALYASICKQSVVILLITWDEQLWKDLWTLTKSTYDKVTLKKLMRSAEQSANLKKKIGDFVKNNCQLLCEVPAYTSSEGSYNCTSRIPMRKGNSNRLVVTIETEMKEKLIQVCKNVMDLMKRGFEMERRKATEAVMLVVNDTDRIFDPDTFYAVPVAYILKGYSLDVARMRKVLDMVMDRLKEEQITVRTTSFDGQWHNIAVKDKDNYPLTKFQLQKYVWNQLGRITKDNLLRILDNWTKVDASDLDVCANSRFLTVGDIALGNLAVKFQCNTLQRRVLHAKCMNGDSNIDAIITKIHTPSSKDRPDLWNEDTSDVQNLHSKNDPDIIKINKDANVITLLPEEFLQTNTMKSAISDLADLNLDGDDELPNIPINNEAIANSDNISHCLLKVKTDFLEQILVGLCSQKRSDIWSSYGIEDLYSQILRNQKSIEKLTSYEMDVINNVFFGYKEKYLFRKNDLKDHKVKIICKLFGRKRKLHRDKLINTKKVTLRKLCVEIIKDIDYPTNVLAVALANAIHVKEKAKWYDKATVPMFIKLPPAGEIHECFSYPEYSEKRQQVEPKLLDPTHILTNIRNHICTKGYDKVKREAFLRVSEKDNEVLNRAYIINIVDKQSAAIAMKFFSSEVQSILMENNDFEESDFVGLVRTWYEAVDERGIPVESRLHNMQCFFEYLSSMVKFDVYPPQTKYICGIPVVTFESLLQMISTRIQLYGLCARNTYNQRSVSTLDIETLFSILSRMEGAFNGCPKATMLSTMIKRFMQMLELQLNPMKIFSLHLSNKKKYPAYNLLSEHDSSTSSNKDDTMETQTFDGYPVVNFKYTTHLFDKRIQRTRRKNAKNVQITTGNKQMRRESGVRINFKAYESKIRCTTRHGFRN